jgi:hypothetical protein
LDHQGVSRDGQYPDFPGFALCSGYAMLILKGTGGDLNDGETNKEE